MGSSHWGRHAGLASLGAGAALLALACHSGKGGAPNPTRTADPDHGVVRFDPAQVKHWPGLANLGSSCFMNSCIKLMAAMPGLDPFLADHPGDDGPTRAVRTALRLAINPIRSGQGGAQGLRPQMQAVLASFQAHPAIRPFVNSTGDDDSLLMGAVLKVLGAGEAFHLKQVTKTIPRDPGQAPAYREDPPSPDRLPVARGDLTGRDFTGVRTVADGVRLAYSGPTSFPGANTAVFPVEVPATLLYNLSHLNAGPGTDLALGFSEQVHVPVFALQPAQRQEIRLREVGLRARAVSVFVPGHFYAVIRGDDGWYMNNDAHPPTQVPAADLDEATDPASGALTRCLTQILFERD